MILHSLCQIPRHKQNHVTVSWTYCTARCVSDTVASLLPREKYEYAECFRYFSLAMLLSPSCSRLAKRRKVQVAESREAADRQNRRR